MRWVFPARTRGNKNANNHRQDKDFSYTPALKWNVDAVPDRDSKIGVAWAHFQSACGSWAGPRFLPFRNYDPSESFQSVFLCQARLYVFGDRYDVEALRSLVLYKLRRALSVFTLFPQRVPDILMLVEYAYENTPEGDDLRDLLSDYALCKVTFLLTHDDWDFFARENPTFTMELLAKLRGLEADDTATW
jgi:hypothetical protein